MASPFNTPHGALRISLTAFAAACAWVGSASAQAPPVSPQDFVNAAGGADVYEIMAANTALGQSQDASVRAFAEEMIHDHGVMLSVLRDAALRSHLEPPSGSVGGDQTMLLASLQSLRGTDFDREYARQQVLAHRSALTTQGDYAREGLDSHLQAAAKASIPIVERHLLEAEALRPSKPES